MEKYLSQRNGYHIGFVSTRFSGTDGVSLETRKWAAVLERLGHTCFYFAGSSDRQPERSFIAPEALFTHPDIRSIYISSFTNTSRPVKITRMISDLKEHLKEQVTAFVREFDIDVIIAENALTIPMNIPLGIALTEFIVEESFPTIAHHHDFYWERQRYLMNCVQDYLSMAFPPRLPTIHHAVINSLAATQLSLRTGVSAMLIPNVMDFDHPPAAPDAYVTDLRPALGLQPDERLILQPTRVVQRKGIEQAIELLRRLGLEARLVISHASGDELDDYEKRVHDYAQLMGVPVKFVSDIIRHDRGLTEDGRKIFALEDVYLEADLVTYPSTVEGFGNAFLEAIYYRKPVVVNKYSIFDLDIRPKGFQVIGFAGYITETTVQQTRQVLEDPQLVQSIAEHNYELGKRYYSYAMLERHLNTLLSDCFGESS
jgi:glycosyltransferase involved in cell wall biosynthesis